MYLVGEPIFCVPWRHEFYAPIGQALECYAILGKSSNMGDVAINLRKEYAAIVHAMYRMELDFRLVCRDIRDIDQGFAAILCQELGCKLAGFPAFSGREALYPRDFCTVFDAAKTLLVNPKSVRLQVSSKDDWSIHESPYGEGGRILHADHTALVGERLIVEDGLSRSTSDADLEVLRGIGIRIGKVPPFVMTTFGYSGRTDSISFNDHLDRIGCLITGQDGSLHLILDPSIYSIKWLGESKQRPWKSRKTPKTLNVFRDICRPLGIEVHTPKTMKVPYSLNLLQVPDGRVLMTSGDSDVEQLVIDIVGKTNVFTTSVPIRFYPVWSCAGIRCLVSEAPEAIMKKMW